MQKEYLIYDCEIVKMIPAQNEERIDGLEYCEGWNDHASMGVSVIGAYSFPFDHAGFVLGDELETFEKLLNDHDFVIGFNSKNFDDRLLAANGIQVTTNYDLLEEIRLAAFGSPRWQDTPKGRSYSLGNIASANGLAKTGTGELAPKLWQQGFKQEVIDYCLNDVIITKAILDLGLAGELVDPNTNRKLQLRSLEAV